MKRLINWLLGRKEPPSPIDLRILINRELCSLGETSDEIAASLAAKGITGIPFNSCECPIANFLKRTFTPTFLTVGPIRYFFHQHQKRGFDGAMPSTISSFIYDFDTGKYPDLFTAKE